MTMKPAMTKEEWGPLEMYPYDDEETTFDGRPHDVAARALYGQPFGFTREDVALLRRHASLLTAWAQDGPTMKALADTNSLADRIEALLPPEG